MPWMPGTKWEMSKWQSLNRVFLTSGISQCLHLAGDLVFVCRVCSGCLFELFVSHHQSATRPDPAAQERERLLTTLQEEASIAKDKVKQLSQVWIPAFPYLMKYDEDEWFISTHSLCIEALTYLCAAGASGREAKDGPGGGHDEGATCCHGERDGEHAGQDTEHLPGAPDHADKGEGFDLLPSAEMNLVV